jgi:hypothetical protein
MEAHNKILGNLKRAAGISSPAMPLNDIPKGELSVCARHDNESTF